MRHKKLQLSFLLLILAFPVLSQTIGTMTWIPQNPTTSDNVKLLVPVSFSNSTCSRTSLFVNKNDPDSITVDGYYCAENPGNCTRTDTFILGQLVAGNVKVRFYLSGPHAVNGCQGFALADIENTLITVGTTTGIQQAENKYAIKIFPNPGNGTLNLEYELPENSKDSRIVFYDIHGKEIKAINLNGSGTLKLNENWESGYYFYRLESESVKTGFEKLIITK